VVLLNGGGHRAADADAIATHDHWMRRACAVEVGGAHGLTIFGAELKDVPDLDAAHDAQLFPAPAARVIRAHQAQVEVAIKSRSPLALT
jgi:hypothetical protein